MQQMPNKWHHQFTLHLNASQCIRMINEPPGTPPLHGGGPCKPFFKKTQIFPKANAMSKLTLLVSSRHASGIYPQYLPNFAPPRAG